MTKEELYNRLRTVAVDSMPSSIQHTLDEFFSQNVVIPKGDVKHLEWIYNRMVEVYGCNKNLDYMLKFASIIGIKPQEPVYEWQYVCYQDDKEIARTVFMTNDECLKCYLPLDYWIRDESTKRVRQ